MNNQQLQTKRQPKKGIKKLNAKVGSARRKQRASAAANPGSLDSNVPNQSIGRALTVILLLHVVAIAAVAIGVQWNKKRTLTAAAVEPAKTVDLSNLNATLNTAFTETGDTYATFAARHNVDEAELRRTNNNAQLFAGKPLYIPPQKIKVAPQNNTHLAVSDRPPLPTSSNVVHVEVAKAQVVQPAAPRAIPVAEASGSTYKVQSGDSIWRISKKHKVSQDALMKLNNLKSARDLKAGMTLQIPAQ